MPVAILLETVQAGSQWVNTFKIEKETVHLEFYFLQKCLSKMEGKIKRFLDKQKLQKYVAYKLALKI